MSGQPPEQPEQKPQRQQDEVDRYERLQNAAERQMANLKDAYDTHASMLKTVVISACFLASVIAVLIVFGFYHNIAEFKDNVRDNLNATLDGMKQNLNATMFEMTNQVDLKIAQESAKVDQGIDERFSKDNIAPMVEAKVREKVNKVTDSIIRENIHDQIDPQFEALTNQIASLEAELMQAKATSEDVKNELDLAMNTTMALSDDRNAFFQLHNLQMTGTNRYEVPLTEAINTSMWELYRQGFPYLQLQINWGGVGFNPDTNSFDDYVRLFGSFSDPTAQILILQKLSEQTRFSRIEKFAFYRALLIQTPSLKILAKTCDIVNNESHLNANVFGAPEYLNWLDNQIITNCTATIRTNRFDATNYILRADAYVDEANYPSAVKDYEKAISLNSTNATVLNSCAWLLAVCPDDSVRDGRRAVEFARKACELTQWKQWYCIGTLAAAHAEVGNFDEAIKYEKQAIATPGAPNDQVASETERLKQFEQHKPTHEALDQPIDLL